MLLRSGAETWDITRTGLHMSENRTCSPVRSPSTVCSLLRLRKACGLRAQLVRWYSPIVSRMSASCGVTAFAAPPTLVAAAQAACTQSRNGHSHTSCIVLNKLVLMPYLTRFNKAIYGSDMALKLGTGMEEHGRSLRLSSMRFHAASVGANNAKPMLGSVSSPTAS